MAATVSKARKDDKARIEVDNTIRNCNVCQQRKMNTKTKKGLLKACDIIGMTPTGSSPIHAWPQLHHK